MGSTKMKGVRQWQVEQAVCNLLLSTSLCNGVPFYGCVPKGEITQAIAQALKDREEKSETREINKFSADQILKQVCLDGLELLRSMGHTARQSIDLEAVQKELASKDLLESRDA